MEVNRLDNYLHLFMHWLSLDGSVYVEPVMIMVKLIFLVSILRAGKQFVWICCSLGLGFILLMLEDKLYDMFAYILYGA